MTDARDRLLGGLDAPRPLPPRVRDELIDLLVTRPIESAPAFPAADLSGLDCPRALPPRVRTALERRLVRRRPAAVRRLAVAAAVLLVVSTSAVLTRDIGDERRARPAPAALGPRERPDRDGAAEAGTAPLPAVSGVGGTGVAAPTVRAPAESAAAGPGGGGPDEVLAPPVRVAVVGGVPDAEAGFRSYLDTVNRAGGVGGRPLAAQVAAPDRPVAGAVATVNLSHEPIATPAGSPAWARGPLLETLAATEELLDGEVFSLASPPERQAHLLADALVPDAEPGRTAVVYQAENGLFGEEIPAALAEVLEDRGVHVTRVTYQPGVAPVVVPAHVAFLSLPQADARRWVAQVAQSGYRWPAVGCVFPMLDESLLGELPSGYRILSPYRLGAADAPALRDAVGHVSVGAVHGWVTAKALVHALRAGATSAAQLRAALTGFDHGFAPPVGFRRGTNARVPEGILYTVTAGGFESESGFRTDPY